MPQHLRNAYSLFSALKLLVLLGTQLRIHVADAFIAERPVAVTTAVNSVNRQSLSHYNKQRRSLLDSNSSSEKAAGYGRGFVDGPSPTVEFVDPETQCRVVLLGCFHGTASSAQDVRNVVTSDTDVVVLELCTQRFADLQRDRELAPSDAEADGEALYVDNSRTRELWWPKSYLQMVSKTIQRQGLATGVAAGLLGGVSGLQSVVSGFTPGLEFKTALDLIGTEVELANLYDDQVDDTKSIYNFDIVLADQDVDETLRKLGNLPAVAADIFFGTDKYGEDEVSKKSIGQVADECQLHLATLGIAIFGDHSQKLRMGRNEQCTPRLSLHTQHQLPQLQLIPVLLRNQAAVQDLLRLAVPSTFVIIFISSLLAAAFGAEGIDVKDYQLLSSAFEATAAIDAPTPSTFERIGDVLTHIVVSGTILTTGFLALVPVVKVILTDRDEILTNGIRAACRRSGKGGLVVAVLGLLHVNGVARRMLVVEHGNKEDINKARRS